MKKTKQASKPYKLIECDILEWCQRYTGPKFHSILCDPPYELNFMNKGWDNSGIVFDPNTWKALKEHLHPGAFCFAFSSTRTLHRMMVAIEDAGFVIHPFMALWNFSNGFPKASNPAYQFDAMEGKKSKTNYVSNEGCADNTRKYNKGLGGGRVGGTSFEAATENRSLWQGHRYGLQALKPAFEPIVCFQKPYPKKVKPVVSMLETGAGALNVDGGRIGYEKSTNPATNPLYRKQNNYKTECGPDGKGSSFNMKKNGSTITADVQGRWPSNLLLCHLPECKCVGVKQIKPKGGLSAKYAGKDYVNKEGKFLKRFKGATRASKDENGEETTASWECVDGCPVLELSSQSGYRKANARKQTPRTKNAIFNISSKGNAKAHDFQDSGTASRYYFQGSWDLNVQESILL